MPKPEEVAVVVVNGTEYRNWKSVTITRDFSEPTSEFVFSAASPTEAGQSWGDLKLKVGDKCQITLGGVKVIDGVIDVRQVAYDARQHELSVHGLSLLVGATYGTVKPSQAEHKNSSFPQIARAVLEPLGIGLVIKGSPSGIDKPFTRVNANIGETVFSFLERLGRMRNLFFVDDADGNLVAHRPGSETEQAQLEEGRNIKSASVMMNDENAFGKIVAHAQQPGNDNQWGDAARDASATASNPAVSNNRELHFPAEHPGDAEDAQYRANHERDATMATMVKATVVVRGWFQDNGQPWMAAVDGQTLIRVKSPMLFPEDEMSLKLQSVTHRQSSEEGTETLLGLVLPSRITGSAQAQTGGDIPNLTEGGADSGSYENAKPNGPS